MRAYSRMALSSIVLTLWVAAGCGSDANDETKAERDRDSDFVAEHAYALVTLVWGDEGPAGYVSLSDTLDLKDLTLDSAREFPGYTSVAVADGQLLVNPSWEDLVVERYDITRQLGWKDGARLGFSNEGVEAVSFHTQYLRENGDAYLDVDVTGRVLWNAIDFEIEGTRSDDVLSPLRDGMELYANSNRTQFVFGDEILRPFSYHSEDWFSWAPATHIVVYDADTHEPATVVDAPCPGLDTITRDEDGNTYLGTWDYSALQPLMKTGAAPCTVRLTPDNALDPGWDSDLTSLTGGRHVVNFRYVGGGKAIGAVLHHEEYGEDYDFTGLAENTDDFWATAVQFHRLWMFDLAKRSAAPVTGIDAFEFANPVFFHAILDGRTFVFLGDGNNGSNNSDETIVYELDDRGRATQRFAAPGTVTQWVQIR